MKNLNQLFEIFLLKQDYLSSEVINRLNKLSSFETLIYKELDKLTIINDYELLQKTSEIIKITFRLNEINREIFFCKDNLIQIEEDRLKNLLEEVLEAHWKLFFIIYDPALHFKVPNPSIDPQVRFKQAFEKLKSIRWDSCLKLKSEAINKSFQKIFRILTTYQSLIKCQHWVLDKKSGFDDSFKVHNYIIRLNILILITLVKDNPENQMLFSTSKGIIRQFYNQHFINQSPDSMQIFSEMMRDNKRLQKLPTKYLYDIVMSTFVGTMARLISSGESNGYLCSGIMCFHFLTKSTIPLELYNALSDMKTKWGDAMKSTTLQVLKINEDLEKPFAVPYCYYTIRELMESTLDVTSKFTSHKYFHDIQLFLNFKDWIQFFHDENVLLQYELKNLVTQCINKIYFEHESKIKLIQESDDCLKLVATLSAEIIFFREYQTRKQNVTSPLLVKLSETFNLINRNEKYLLVRKLYDNHPLKDFNKKLMNMDGEDIPVEIYFNEYIFNGCLDLLFNIILKEVDFCREVREGRSEITSIMDFVLLMIEEFILGEQNNPLLPAGKIEAFLNNASVINRYTSFKEQILRNTTRLRLRRGERGMSVAQGIKIAPKEISHLDIFTKHIQNLQTSKKVYKDQNIKQVADCIAEHPQNKRIIEEILKYLERDPTKLDIEESVFLVKLLRKYIERENTWNSQDEPIYLWKEVNFADLKRIEKIQQAYKYGKLSDTLFELFKINNPTLFRETILLSLAYMYGGNRGVQMDFYNKLREDDENTVITQLRERLETSWNHFRNVESKRIQFLYGSVQKAMFNYFKGKKALEDVDQQELQMKVLQVKMDSKYIESADKLKKNQIFIQTLTFLQALCEGQYTEMQHFLREQKEDGILHSKSFDFLSFLRHSTNTYYKVFSKYNLTIGNKILDLIIELVQGEVQENIAVFLYKTFIYDMCRTLTDFNTRYHTLPRGFGMNLFHQDFREFKGKVIFLFKTILENKNSNNMQVMTTHLDIVGLMDVFETLMSEFVETNDLASKLDNTDQFIFSLTNEHFKTILGDAINIYIIFRYIWESRAEFSEKMRELIKGKDQVKQDFLDSIINTIFPKLVGSIEIIVDTKENKPLIRVWFPVIAVCHYLSMETKNHFLDHVERDNSQKKLSSLIEKSHEFVPQMYAEYGARNRVFGFNMNNIYYGLRLISNLAAIVITGINVGTFDFDFSDGESKQDEIFTNVTFGLNIGQIALAGILIIFWLTLFRKRHLTLMWEVFVERKVKANGKLPPTIETKLNDGDHKELLVDECYKIMLLKGANSDEFKEMQKLSPNYQKIKLRFNLYNIWFVIKSPDLLWHCLYLGVTIGSLFHPLVAIFQIFDIAIRSDTLIQIYKSISRNASQFVWTLFLLALINLVYSSIGFFFLNDIFKDENGEVLCDTSFSCFLNVLNLGLRSGGGIADIIVPQYYSPDKVGIFIGRVIFDLSFFILLIILLLNLIFGMIIDAFGELRDQKTNNDKDKLNVCFICGEERSQFERYGKFEDHLDLEHNTWDYIYYIVYILDKQKTAKNSMTDIELLVLDKYNKKDFEWIPIARSLFLENAKKTEKSDKEVEMSQLVSTIGSIKERVDEIFIRMDAKK